MTFTLDTVITLLILAGAIVLFLINRPRADVVALLVLVSLATTGVLTPQEAFSGFSRSAVITVVAIFVLAQGLYLTGASDRVGSWLVRVAGRSERRLVILAMLSGAFLSLFMNNIAAASVLLPAVSSAARRQRVNPSRLLMPLAYATILGGMATLFTTANIVMSGLLREQGLAGYGVLDFAPVGLPIVVAGILYMAVFGRRLLPEHSAAERFADTSAEDEEADLAEVYQLEQRLFRARIPPGSYLEDKPLVHSTFREKYNLNVVAVEHDGQVTLAPPPDMVFHVGDIVTLEGRLEEFVELDSEPYLEILDSHRFQERDLESSEIGVFEVVLAPRSNMIGKTLQEVNFREKFNFTALAIWRAGRPIRRGMTTTVLEFGDALLLQGPRSRLRLLRDEPDLILLGGDVEPAAARRPGKMGLAVLLMAAALILAATNILPTAEAMLAGSLAMVLTGVLMADEAYSAVEWRAVVLVAGMLPLGLALTKTGVAEMVAQGIVQFVEPYGVWALLAGLVLMTMLLVQIISGPALAAIVGPLAIKAAEQMGANPTHLALGVAIAASMAFLTPLGHPVNILVMGPGGYKFSDYFKVGLPLTILAVAVLLIVLPLIYPL